MFNFFPYLIPFAIYAVFLEIATNLPPYGWQISPFSMKNSVIKLDNFIEIHKISFINRKNNGIRRF